MEFLGTIIFNSDNNKLKKIPIPVFGVYKYIQILSNGSDILLESIDFIYNVDTNKKVCTNLCLCEPFCSCESFCKCGIGKYTE